MRRRVISEIVAGEIYEYIPFGKYVVSAPAVCRGRRTFKCTRIEVSGVLQLLRAGASLDQLVADYRGRVPREAIAEAIELATKALQRQPNTRAKTS